jgi:NAD(P)H dehydrogenase (quinone)
MNVLIIHAHPEPNSFNGALTRRAIHVLEEQGCTVRVSDLYAMGWDPVSSRKNFSTTKDSTFFKPQAEEVYAAEHGGFAPDIQAEMDKVVWCDTLIFQFPLWWFSIPAILKGWVDRVFAMGFAYGGGRIYETGVFRGKRAMLSLTTGGPEEMLYFVGMDVLPPFVVYGPARASEDKRREYLDCYGRRLLALETTPPLRFS